MDLEAAGGAVTGGIIAGAIEKRTGQAGEHHTICADCGAEVTGRFCSNCGQPAHVHRTLLHLAEELLHGVMHFDGRFWRTLPLLLLNPGRLTREWVQGRRTRYVSPLAMFLFTLFVMFFALSFVGGNGGLHIPVGNPQADLPSLRQSLTETKATLAELEAAQGVGRSEVGIAATRQAIALIEHQIAEKEAAAKPGAAGQPEGQATGGPGGAPTTAAERHDGLTPGSWQAGVADVATAVGKDDQANSFTKAVAKKLLNPDLALYKLQQTMYKFAFLLVPLSIPFVALMFLWKRGFTLYDHGVFVLYSLTFMSLLLMVAVVVATTIKGAGGWAAAAACLIAPAHMFAQLKGAYGLSIFSTLWRTVALLIFCEIVATLFIVSIIYLGLGH